MNEQNREVNLNFITGLQNKDIKLISSTLSESVSWYTGEHFGVIIGRITCLNHMKMRFFSLFHLKFIIKQLPISDNIAVLEFGLKREGRVSGYQKKNAYSGVFILEFAGNKIQNIRTYHEDRSTHPRLMKSPRTGGRSPMPKQSNTQELDGGDYDPETGLPPQ